MVAVHMHLYFAFGSNMAAATLAERQVVARLVGPAYAADHRLAFTLVSQRWTGRAADLLPQTGDRTWGVVWDLADPHALDPFERRYDRVPITVTRSNGDLGSEHNVDAFTYTVKAQHRDRTDALPAPAYLERMVAGARDAGIPRSYLRFLNGFRG